MNEPKILSTLPDYIRQEVPPSMKVHSSKSAGVLDVSVMERISEGANEATKLVLGEMNSVEDYIAMLVTGITIEGQSEIGEVQPQPILSFLFLSLLCAMKDEKEKIGEKVTESADILILSMERVRNRMRKLLNLDEGCLWWGDIFRNSGS